MSHCILGHSIVIKILAAVLVLDMTYIFLSGSLSDLLIVLSALRFPRDEGGCGSFSLFVLETHVIKI